ncbi:MAG: hypothetical protein KBT11_03645 [Treponema sp.]|nr:hypothetical protein [Candidatus Treponema equifaecale]
MKCFLVLLFVCMFVTGCQSNGFLMGKAQSTLINDSYPPKSFDAEIDVYVSNKPEQKYIEIAMISCLDTNDDWCLKELKRKARELGADAIIILGKAGKENVGIPVGNMFYFVDEQYGLKGVAIKYKD